MPIDSRGSSGACYVENLAPDLIIVGVGPSRFKNLKRGPGGLRIVGATRVDSSCRGPSTGDWALSLLFRSNQFEPGRGELC